MKRVTWLESLRQRLQRSRRTLRRRAAQAEGLEQRTYLSATALVVNGQLTVVVDSDESIEIGVNSSGTGEVQVFFDGVQTTSLSGVQASQLTGISVQGGPGDNLIDLTQVTAADFSFAHPTTGEPISILVNGGDGDDTLLGSFDLNDSLFGGDGDDLINTLPVAEPATPLPTGTTAALAIVNGTPTSQFSSVGVIGNALSDFASGTLISPRHVLTSATSVSGLGDDEVRFTLGASTYSSVAVHVQPNFDAALVGTDAGNDLAIVELDQDVVGVTPSAILRAAPSIGTSLTLVGYGAGGDATSGQDGTFGILQSGTTAVDGVGTTLVVWNFDNATEANSAPGDSGGPAFVTTGGQQFVAAVISGNDSSTSALGDRGFATRLDVHAPWIDFIVGTPGISNRQGNLTIDGGDGHDTIYGGDGDDSIDAGDGRDEVVSGAGRDTVVAGDGQDTVDAGDGDDFISGGDSADSIRAGDGDDTVTGDAGADTLLGGSGSDSLVGGAHDDVLLGDGGGSIAGNDTLEGGAGADVLIGGGANDLMDGGSGADVLDVGDQTLSIDDVTVASEGDFGSASTATFTVALSRSSAVTISVDFTTVDGTATAGLDYVAASGTLTFAPGTTTQTVTVDIIGDAVPELDENFSIQLSSPDGAFISDTIGQATIVDDLDGPVQTVFLDFDSGTSFFDRPFTPAERDEIQTLLEADYDPFNVVFTQTAPTFGQFATIFFNDLGPFSFFPGLLGIAVDGIDFRNLMLSDRVFVDVLNAFPGLTVSSDIVAASAGTAAHELGHAMGLRHGDSFGPIGTGVHNPPGPISYAPIFPGPAGAFETNMHIMASGASTGLTLADRLEDRNFGARSAVKLSMFAFEGQVLAEQFGTHDTVATAQPLTLADLPVPNTEPAGSMFEGLVFDVDATSMLGRIAVPGEVDVYSFDAQAGDLINIELMSSVFAGNTVPRVTSVIDGRMSITDASGNLIPYYSAVATNDDEFETPDSIIIDLMIPADGTYYINVEDMTGTGTGDYELFIYDFDAIMSAQLATGVQSVPVGQVTMIGGAGNDSLNGSDNADLIIGGGGHDVITAADGNDTVYGGGGRDTIDGGDGNDTVVGNGGLDLLEGGAGDDFLNGSSSRDRVYGDDIAGLETGNDTVAGGEGRDMVFGGAGDDLLLGGQGHDTLEGGDGSDTLRGQTGHDLIDGGADDDLIIWPGRRNDTVVGTDGLDSVLVEATSGDDDIRIGQVGSTVQIFFNGNMLDIQGPTTSLANPVELVTINARGGNDRVRLVNVVDDGMGGTREEPADFRSVGAMILLIDGGAGHDVLDGTGVALGDVRLLLDGGDGFDILRGTRGGDTLVGGAGNDTLHGGPGDDTLRGGDGSDELDGQVGDDSLEGGDRNDTLIGGSGNDSADGGDGNDVVEGGDGDDTLVGNLGDDLLNGQDGDDLIEGNDGFDTLTGGAGGDTLDGGRSDDTLTGGNGNDKLRGDHGDDQIDAGSGDDTVDGGDGDDVVLAGSGNDGISGGNGNDLIIGQLGDDTLSGGDGDDSLIGAGGNDIVLGGLGNDAVSGNSGRDTLDGGQGFDVLPDANVAIDTVFNPLNPFPISDALLDNLDASN
ncbi:MAG: Calx-beta domain-containing protein [Planctomycetota bacterium]|jgi:Ca2+-binding RTX toxin-like protein